MSVAVYDDDDEPHFDDELYERRMRVLSLRLGGMTYREIAQALKIDPSTARRDEQIAKRSIAGDDAESIIAGHRAVIADMRRANYRDMLQGNKDASATILKGLDHEARLLGLYAPTRIQAGPSHVEFSERAAELIAAMSPDTLKELLRGTNIDPAVKQQPADEQPAPLDVETVEAPTPADSERGPDEPRPAEPDQRGADVEPDEDDDGWANIGA